jgi:hypothetical protein
MEEANLYKSHTHLNLRAALSPIMHTFRATRSQLTQLRKIICVVYKFQKVGKTKQVKPDLSRMSMFWKVLGQQRGMKVA